MTTRRWTDWIVFGAAALGTCLMGVAVGLVTRRPETVTQPFDEIRFATVVFWCGVAVAALLPIALVCRRSIPRLRRSLQVAFSIRKFYLAAALLFLAADLCALWPFFRQSVALREIDRLGGNYFFNSPRRGGPLRQWVGEQVLAGFDDVEFLNLTNTPATDAIVPHINRIRGVTYLSLANTKITDAGLKRLTGLARLTKLDLSATSITDAGLAHVATVAQKLETLELSETDIDDAGVENLAALKQLISLSLRGTRVTDAALPSLKFRPRLFLIDASHTQVTDAGLKELGQAIPIDVIISNSGTTVSNR